VPGLPRIKNAPDRPNVLTAKKSQKNDGSNKWVADKNASTAQRFHAFIDPRGHALTKFQANAFRYNTSKLIPASAGGAMASHVSGMRITE
jgi:hypothetical protein